MVMLADQVSEFWNYFVGIGFLPEGKMRIMNKYIAGSFKKHQNCGVPDTDSGCCDRYQKPGCMRS